MDPGHSRLAHMTVRIKMQGAVQWQVSVVKPILGPVTIYMSLFQTQTRE